MYLGDLHAYQMIGFFEVQVEQIYMRLLWVQPEVRMNPVIERFFEMKGNYFFDPLDDLEDFLEDFLEMNENLDDFFAHDVFEDDHGIDPLEMNGNDFFDDDLDDFFALDVFENDHEIDPFEMNVTDFFAVDSDDFFDQLNDPEDFLEMNEDFAQDAFENDHEIDLFEMNTNDFFDPFDGSEDFLEMNENLDDFFAENVFQMVLNEVQVRMSAEPE